MLNVDIIGKLVPNVLTLIVQLCSTLVLFLLAKKFLWKSVSGFLDKRQEKMQADLTASETARREAQSDREAAAKQLSDASWKAEEIVNAAVKEAQSEKDQILAQAAKEADQEKQKAHEQIELERSRMYAGMRREMVDVAMAAASKLIGEKSGADLDRQAIDEFVKEASGHDE